MNSKINRVSEGLFRQLIEAGTDYRTEVITTVNEYKSKLQSVQETANKRYKVKDIIAPNDYSLQQNIDRQREEEQRIVDRYRSDYVQEKKSALTAEARERIRKAQDGFQVTAKEVAKQLRNQLEEAVLAPINTGFLRLAETLSTFGIAPSRLELDALLTLSENNLTATRCLDALLKQTNAPFVLQYKHPDDFLKDLTAIEELATDSVFCSPLDCHHEMCEIFRNQKVSRDEESVSFKRGETFDSVSLLIYGQSFDLGIQNVENMIASWATDIHFEVADALSAEMEQQERDVAELLEREPELPDYKSPTQVLEDGEDGTALAVELGREAAAAKAPVSESLGDLVR